jgi:hypothetical protein
MDPNRCYVLKIVADSKFLAEYQKLILVSDSGYLQVIDAPAASEKAGASVPLTVSSVNPPAVGLNEVVTVTVTGTGLSAVKQVSFEGKPLSFWAPPNKTKSTGGTNTSSPVPAPSPATSAAPSSDETKTKTEQIEVLLSRDLTGKAGRQDLLLQVDAKNIATATVIISPASSKVPDSTTTKSTTPNSKPSKSTTPSDKKLDPAAPSSDTSGSPTSKSKTE